MQRQMSVRIERNGGLVNITISWIENLADPMQRCAGFDRCLLCPKNCQTALRLPAPITRHRVVRVVHRNPDDFAAKAGPAGFNLHNGGVISRDPASSRRLILRRAWCLTEVHAGQKDHAKRENFCRFHAAYMGPTI